MAPQSPFLRLPGEIRKRIYGYAFDWPDIMGRIETIKEAIPSIQDDEDADDNYNFLLYQPFITPTILLLNRQINTEAMAVILATPMTIPLSLPSRTSWSEIPDLTFFVPQTALDAVQIVKVVIDQEESGRWRVSRNVWKQVLKHLAGMWYYKTNLESFTALAPGQHEVEDKVEVYMALALGVSCFECILFLLSAGRVLKMCIFEIFF